MSYVTIIIFRSSHEGIHDDNIINAAEAFNSQFNIKYWVVHYEVSHHSVVNAFLIDKQFLCYFFISNINNKLYVIRKLNFKDGNLSNRFVKKMSRSLSHYTSYHEVSSSEPFVWRQER